ncbi:MAG: FAD-dependent oxidoreductase [Acidobacteriota bacterium]
MTRFAIVGAGMIGTAVACELAEAGADVVLVHDGPVGGGATAAGMGHLVALPGSPGQTELTQRSLALWRSHSLPDDCETLCCGTLWVARDTRELEELVSQAWVLRDAGTPAELIPAKRLRVLEPELRPDLAGGLRVLSDRAIYAPRAAAELWRRAHSAGARRRQARVAAVAAGQIQMANGTTLEADCVVLAAGDRSRLLWPQLPVRPRKGHLLITTRRATPFIYHQIIEAGYTRSAHGRADASVACNVQPRPTGQVLIGSSRQEGIEHADVEPAILQRMLQRAATYLPGIERLTALRAWTGMRAATPDGEPLIGWIEDGLAVATGHEGLGITQAPATAELLSQLVLGWRPTIDPAPYCPQRFAAKPARRPDPERHALGAVP